MIKTQINQIKVGGLRIIYRKLKLSVKLIVRKIFLIAFIIVSAPIVLIIVFLRPFLIIRFGVMTSSRLGHFGADTEAYLCLKDQEKEKPRTIDIISCPEPVCNIQLQKMWTRTLAITPGAWFWSLLDIACQKWTKSKIHHVKLYDNSPNYKLFLATNTHLAFVEEELLKGQELLKQLGVPDGASWVCIHNRDSSYLSQAQPNVNWSYHDYRDFSVQTMGMAALELAKYGYYVLRMGSVVAEPLLTKHTRIIDYACHPVQSDFGDIYLLANCTFHLGSDSGIFAVPAIFRKPFSFINFAVISVIFKTYYWNQTPFIIKRLWHREKARFLSLREVIEMKLDNAGYTEMYDHAGVNLVSNTPGEIRDLAIEVEQRIKGEWQPQPDDESLQKEFWDILRYYYSSEAPQEIKARIGAAFLRKHIDLLN